MHIPPYPAPPAAGAFCRVTFALLSGQCKSRSAPRRQSLLRPRPEDRIDPAAREGQHGAAEGAADLQKDAQEDLGFGGNGGFLWRRIGGACSETGPSGCLLFRGAGRRAGLEVIRQ